MPKTTLTAHTQVEVTPMTAMTGQAPSLVSVALPALDAPWARRATPPVFLHKTLMKPKSARQHHDTYLPARTTSQRYTPGPCGKYHAPRQQGNAHNAHKAMASCLRPALQGMRRANDMRPLQFGSELPVADAIAQLLTSNKQVTRKCCVCLPPPTSHTHHDGPTT